MKIKIPFRSEMKAEIMRGRKTCTSRTRKYGDPGDTFEAGEGVYVLTAAKKETYKFIKETLFKQEGFDTPEAFEKLWYQIYPRHIPQPDEQFWVHYFKEV